MSKVKVKLKKTMLLQNDDGDYFCLGCRQVYGVILPDRVLSPSTQPKFCPYCGAEVERIFELGEEDTCFEDSWIEVIA